MTILRMPRRYRFRDYLELAKRVLGLILLILEILRKIFELNQ